MANSDEHLVYLVDGSGYIFRAYHALPPLTRSDGTPVGAVSGFCNMLYKLVDDLTHSGKATHLAVIFDASGKSFRNEIYPDYKANRPPAPEDLVPQFPLFRDAVRAFNLPCIEMEGYEADDLIATYAEHARESGHKVVIVSSDKDLMQLVDDNITMLDPMKNRKIGIGEVHEKFFVSPDKVVDIQSLAGDSTDNVPGVPGIGVKTAAQLIDEYGDLDTLLARAEEIKQPKRRQNLIEYAEQARISRELVRLKRDVEVSDGVLDFTIAEPDPERLIGFLEEMEFKTLTQRVRTRFGDAEGGPASVAVADAPPDDVTYELVTDMKALERWIEEIRRVGHVAVDTETTSLDAVAAELVGISLSTAPGKACYIPLRHKGEAPDGELDFGSDGSNAPEQIPVEDAIAALKPVFTDPGILKIGQNIKYDCTILERAGTPVHPVDDTMLLSFVLDAGSHGHGMDELAQRHLDYSPIPYKEVAGTGKAQVTFDRVPLDKALDYAAEDADITYRLWQLLKPRLAMEKMATVYETIERPLVPVISAMEQAGVKVDADILREMSNDFATRAEKLETEIHKLAGEEFKVGSPKQLGEILFDKLGLEGGKKGKTGAYATGADILEDLAAQGHELPRRVLDWRQLTKLKSTYTDALQEQIDAKTGRVHTAYHMAGASTGRLASSDPNLQNIPIRTEEGRKIRRAFVAEKGCKLISADYSQIELRILAHIADIAALKQAFADGADIHAMTASEVFGVPLDQMDGETRRKAKAINFGIIYGISAFGLARQLAIPQGEARSFIDAYFERYPGVRDYMDEAKAHAREHGFVTTLYGRRIHVAGIRDKNPAKRNFSERAAINAPIQGSAADVIKRAMIRIPGAMSDAGLKTKMLLQVHDELIFEAPEDEVERVIETVKSTMEGAASLSVPLTVEAGVGDSWADAH
ncbi:MAG: DNA polymerase I [Minwuia sp.]|uniref:DNA polymerase I n=1 Tax=Minwuia sp. TaxID=2493630 RepID=UPI003A8724C9